MGEDGVASTRGSSDVQRETADTSVWHSFRAYPAFRTLFHSTLTTNTSFWMWNIAIGWLALTMTDSPFFVGLTSFLAGIPVLIFTIPGGALIDRFDRKRVLLAAQSGVTAVAITISVLLLLDRLEPWQLLVLAFANGTAMSLVFPTRNALVANFVAPRDLANAVALMSAGQNSTRVIGPAAAGPMIATLGVKGSFIACAVVLVLSMVVTLRLPRAIPTPSAARRTLLGSMTEGIVIIWRSEYLLGLVVLAAVPTMLVMPYSNLLPVFARDVMKVGATGLGVLMAANGLGGVVGALLVAGWQRLVQQRGIVVWSAIAFGVTVAAFALIPIPLIACVLTFIAGAVSSVYLALNNTKIQLAVDDSVRGRVSAVYMLSWGLLPVGTLPIGAVADVYGAPIAVAGAAVIAVSLVVLTAVRFPSLISGKPSPEGARARR